ncbi:threonine ammonia-lyase [Kineosporia succinea]|uniref:Threonine dehydratase n=1 Tax=Kineosporia succinea TaxID=84632 RepID=A0ABT9PDI4_9ACTN|nr:pyridoxal-phosphate dependent enzyme [Kineosporia succinea]MDP9830757.1 threonine dehydratase [Kineosporia succinea]
MSTETPGPVRTPVTHLPGGRWKSLAVKDETRQKSGAFKYRGTSHRVAGLPRGTRLVAASTGNHASGLAAASAEAGHRLTVYVPGTTPRVKLDRITGAGAEPVLIEGGYDDCELAARQAAQETGALFVHSFDDDLVIDGHRSLFRECEEQFGLPDVVFVPVGGGGLVTAALREWGGRVRVVGVEYDGAPALERSLSDKERVTLDSATGMPEGLLVRRIGRIAFDTATEHALEVLTVSDADLQVSMRKLWSDAGIRAEGAGAAALAAALHRGIPEHRALCVVSGGNIDEATWRHWVEGPTLDRADAS